MRLRQRVKEVRGQLLARQGELSAELQRVESALRELVPSGLIVSSAPRIGTTPVTIPQVRHGDLRDFLAALLTANPQGLLTTEMEEAARTAKRRPRKNEIHTLVHALYESGYLTREGRRFRLIDTAGLKGLRIGDAVISDKHANFFVNDGQATAEDIRALVAEAWNSVRDQFGIEMELEVELVGDWAFE